jgi:NTP pyrophosphatase (non-canonical NTP hydrolase)
VTPAEKYDELQARYDALLAEHNGLQQAVTDLHAPLALTFARLQQECAEWVAHNFPNHPNHHPVLGVVEELGELAESILRQQGESWIPVKSYEDVYEVSDYGNVRRSKGGQGAVQFRVLKPMMNADGYLEVNLYSGGARTGMTVGIHLLVAEAWLGERPKEFQTNHIDGDKTNNAVWNLEYVSPSYNQTHAIVIGARRVLRGEEVHNTLLSDEQVAEIRVSYMKGSRGSGATVLGRRFGVSKGTIYDIVHNRRHRPQKDYSDLKRLVKMQSAVRKLCHAILKSEQGIRGTHEQHMLDAQDAIGDMLVYLADVCATYGFDMQDIAERTWAKVRVRDWQSDPASGGE